MAQNFRNEKGQNFRNRQYKVENLFRPKSGVHKLPRTSGKDCVLVPFALTACIPESAIRKYAAKEPFTVHVDDGISKSVVLYLGDGHKSRNS